VFNLPAYPDVYNSRHITCISCKEKFVVTEGHQAKKPADSEWRVRPNLPSSINLHYEGNRQQRPVVPTPHQLPMPPEDRIGTRQPIIFTPYPINCPRCGADNRNWLSLKEAGKGTFWKLWQQRFPSANIAFLISLLFAFVALLLPLLFDISWPQAIILALCTIIATLLVVADLSTQWADLREDRHIAKILPKSRRIEPVLWVRSFGWLFIAAVILPLLFFTAGPASFQKIVEYIDKPPETDVENVAQDIAVDFDQQINQAVNNLNAFGEEVGKTIEGFPNGDLPQVEQQLENLSDDLENAAAVTAEEIKIAGQASITNIDARLETEIARLETARKSARTRLLEEIMADVRYLALWNVILGLPLLFAIMIMIPAVKKFAAKVDNELPPPVFYSVANMTRLVTWESRQALEIGNQHYDIQWMSVERNKEGGLDLVGLFRDLPEFDMYGQLRQPMVRAQKHTIHTDKWCRVINANIEDVMVPIPAGAPVGAFPLASQSQHDAPATVRIRLPER
jgi:hypothetical protein